jgi:HPt (histidine-containing phosphotransfer) domain-containing protein
MDDHVAKPFRRAQLRAAMERWAGSPTSAVAASPGIAQPDGPGSQTIDQQALLKRLQVGGRTRPALVAKVIGLFLADTPTVLDALTQGLHSGDVRAVERAVHTIKSSANAVGAVSLSQLAGVAEGHARGGSLDAVRGQVGEIRRQFDAAVLLLDALRAELLRSQTEVFES